MPTPMLIQADVDTALSDFATKLAAASTAFVAMSTVQFPATSYATAAAQSDAIKAAGVASDAIAALFANAQGRAAAVGDEVKALLPVS